MMPSDGAYARVPGRRRGRKEGETVGAVDGLWKRERKKGVGRR